MYPMVCIILSIRYICKVGDKAMNDGNKKAMISQPMNGLSEDVIKLQKEKAENYLEKKGYDIVNTFFDDEWSNSENMKASGVRQIPVAFLGKAILKMAMCDAVYFCKGWDAARGCKIEHEIASSYGLTILYEE